MLKVLGDAPRAVGIYAQSLGAALLTELGFQLATPLDASLPYDLLASRDGEMKSWSKIQIKQASRDGSVGLRRGDKRAGCKSYVSGDFDYLLVVDLGAAVFLLRYSEIQSYRSGVCVRDLRFQGYRVTDSLMAVRNTALPPAVATVEQQPQLQLFPACAA